MTKIKDKLSKHWYLYNDSEISFCGKHWSYPDEKKVINQALIKRLTLQVHKIYDKLAPSHILNENNKSKKIKKVKDIKKCCTSINAYMLLYEQQEQEEPDDDDDDDELKKKKKKKKKKKLSIKFHQS